jgi:cardiolipin synthase C
MKRLLLIVLVAVAGFAAGCASLPPPPQDRIASTAVRDTGSTKFGRVAGPLASAHPALSGLVGLEEPHGAFAARVLLAGSAEVSIDAQYFIWHDDEVGLLLWQALWQAAGRGVRVRLLLDDANMAGLDPVLATLDAHPNLEVRLYNPFVQRSGSRTLAYLSDFGRLNRRMHNKSFTVDNQVTVVGGRNIANEYFGAAGAISFADIDLMAIGPVVDEVSTQFDRYWNSASAYPAAPFVGAPPPDAAAALEARFAAARADAVAQAYHDALQRSAAVADLLAGKLDLQWEPARVFHDDPAKTLDRSGERRDVLLFPELVRQMGQPQRSIDLVSPYFVPGDEGTAALVALARSGVRVRVLTNSLASSDERVVHAGYMKRRAELLSAGVKLYEMKPSAADAALETLRVRGRFGAGKVSGLHAKTFAVDDQRIFIGSFNFDQRSALLNTEMGVVIEGSHVARRLARLFDTEVPALAYEVRLADDGPNLVWIERRNDGATVSYDVDPESTWAQRFVIGLLAGLPIEWLL